jgi:hypothetical protein
MVETLYAMKRWMDGWMRYFSLYSKLGAAKDALANGETVFGMCGNG